MNKVPRWEIVLIGLLSVLFLLILGSSYYIDNYEYSVEFYEEVEVSQDPRDIEIGMINIENSGIFTSRVFLPEYFVCDDKNRFSSINYKNSFYVDGPFASRGREAIEVSAMSSKNVSVTTFISSNRFEEEKIEEIRIYERSQNDRVSFNSCEGKTRDEAQDIIRVNYKDEN